MLSFLPPNHGAAKSWLKAQGKVVGCKWISTLIPFHPSLSPSLCNTSLASYSTASSSAKSHSPDLSDILIRDLSHVSNHICWLRLLREATPLSLTHIIILSDLRWRLHRTILLPLWLFNAYGLGFFPAFQSAGEGEWASTASATPEGTFQPKWLLTNPCSAAGGPLGYSNELEQKQSHLGGAAGGNSE